MSERLYKDTGETCHALHIRLWTWLSQHPHSGKDQWPEWASNGGSIPLNNVMCFACVWGCRECPLTWPRSYGETTYGLLCLDASSPYELWWHGDNEERMQLARQIAEMEWKEV